MALTLPVLCAQPRISLKPLDLSLAGITVIAPNDPTFQTAVSGLIEPADMPAFQSMLQYSIIVRNGTAKSLLGICVNFEVGKHGKSEDSANIFANFLASRRPLVAAGKMLVFAVEEGAKFLSKNSRANVTTAGAIVGKGFFDSAQAIEISVDSAIFEDGAFVGPDKRNTFERWSAELTGMRTVAGAVAAYRSQGGELARASALSEDLANVSIHR
jgi:hypothetical protein